MTRAMLLLALAGTPILGPAVTSPKPDGSWKCAAACYVDGNVDGGSCHVPISATGPTEDACKAKLATRCAATKPPPGGCRLGAP